jgi:hypothetical protein
MEEKLKKLEVLRDRWSKEPNNRKIIEVQAKLLKMAMEKETKMDKQIEIAKEVFKGNIKEGGV